MLKPEALIFIRRNPALIKAYSVFVREGDKLITCAKVESTDITGNYDVDPLVNITEEMAQQIMDELWREGIRPNNGEGSLTHIAALEYHLEDMRKLAFKL